jgi:hypothetical protein
MFILFWVVVALIGAIVHRWRDKQPRSTARTIEILLLWWVGVVLGVASIFGGIYHLVDQVTIADQIGFTNGDGGFQAEVGFADIAFGVTCLVAVWVRGTFMAAALLVISIGYIGDGFGHIHQQISNDDYAPDNGGVILAADFLTPLIGWLFYGLFKREERREKVESPGAAATSS